MRLGDAIDRLSSFDQGRSIYVKPPIDAASEATECCIAFESDDGVVSPDPGDMRYLLEVGLAHEAIMVASDWRGRVLSPEEKVRAVLHYALTDSYLPADLERP